MISWMKHFNNTSHQPAMRRILERFGYQGYGLYNCILERVMQLNGLISINLLMHEFHSHNITCARVREIILMSEMFEISDDGLVTIAASTMLGKNPVDRPKPSRANLLNTLDKEERYKKDSSIDALISASTSESERDFYLRMKAEYPRVCQMPQPLTFAEMQRLLTDHPKERIHAALNDMENYPHLLTRYLSANRTLRKWIK